jgi:hypothetical protein
MDSTIARSTTIGESSFRNVLSDVHSRHNSTKSRQKFRTARPENQPPPAIEQIAPSAARLGDATDAQDAYEFDIEVYQFMRRRELERLPDRTYFQQQTKITPEMRTVVIDWLVEVHKNLKMHTDTLYTAIELMDLYLSRSNLEKTKLQLLGSTALLIAGKSEEIHPPSARKLVFVANRAFSIKDINQMESELFLSLDCQINLVHSSQFMKRFLRLVEQSTKFSMLAHFLNEIALLDEEFIGMRPSQKAAGVIYLTNALLNKPGKWTPALARDTGYTEIELEPVVQQLLDAVHKFQKSKYQAISKKYSVKSLAAVSEMEFPESLHLD